MIVYPDSSFIVSLYIPNVHSAEARRRLRYTPMVVTPLHRAEWAHAVARAVSVYGVSAKELHAVTKYFERDCRSGLWKDVALPEMAFERCIRLAEQYAARLSCGTLDTLHVASALELGAERFLTFDNGQAKLARLTGLKL